MKKILLFCIFMQALSVTPQEAVKAIEKKVKETNKQSPVTETRNSAGTTVIKQDEKRQTEYTNSTGTTVTKSENGTQTEYTNAAGTVVRKTFK